MFLIVYLMYLQNFLPLYFHSITSPAFWPIVLILPHPADLHIGTFIFLSLCLQNVSRSMELYREPSASWMPWVLSNLIPEVTVLYSSSTFLHITGIMKWLLWTGGGNDLLSIVISTGQEVASHCYAVSDEQVAEIGSDELQGELQVWIGKMSDGDLCKQLQTSLLISSLLRCSWHRTLWQKELQCLVNGQKTWASNLSWARRWESCRPSMWKRV